MYIPFSVIFHALYICKIVDDQEDNEEQAPNEVSEISIAFDGLQHIVEAGL